MRQWSRYIKFLELLIYPRCLVTKYCLFCAYSFMSKCVTKDVSIHLNKYLFMPWNSTIKISHHSHWQQNIRIHFMMNIIRIFITKSLLVKENLFCHVKNERKLVSKYYWTYSKAITGWYSLVGQELGNVSLRHCQRNFNATILKFISGRNDFLFSGGCSQRVTHTVWATPMLKDRETFGGAQLRPRPI